MGEIHAVVRRGQKCNGHVDEQHQRNQAGDDASRQKDPTGEFDDSDEQRGGSGRGEMKLPAKVLCHAIQMGELAPAISRELPAPV